MSVARQFASKPICATPTKAAPSQTTVEDKQRKPGRKPSGKEIVTIRLDPRIRRYYRETVGDGWQAKLNDDLLKFLKL